MSIQGSLASSLGSLWCNVYTKYVHGPYGGYSIHPLLSCSMHAKPGPQPNMLYHLQSNDQVMIWWMCGVTTKDQVKSQDLLEKMQLDDRAKVLSTHRLRCHDQVEHSDGWLKKVQNLIPWEVGAVATLRKPGQKWSTWMPSAGSDWDPPFRQESIEW